MQWHPAQLWFDPRVVRNPYLLLMGALAIVFGTIIMVAVLLSL
jgi:hypothetical protein